MAQPKKRRLGCKILAGILVVVVAYALVLTIIDFVSIPLRQVGLLPTSTPIPTSTITPTPTNTPVATDTPTPLPPTNTPIPTFHLGTEGYSGDIPAELVMGVGDTLTTNINDSVVDITLVGFEEVRIERFGSHKTRHFKTEFLIQNKQNTSIAFSPEAVFFAANDGGYRYSRGGATHLTTEDDLTVEGNSQASIILAWETDAYNTIGGGTGAETIWITVNTPIAEGISVTLGPNSGVFRIDFPESES